MKLKNNKKFIDPHRRHHGQQQSPQLQTTTAVTVLECHPVFLRLMLRLWHHLDSTMHAKNLALRALQEVQTTSLVPVSTAIEKYQQQKTVTYGNGFFQEVPRVTSKQFYDEFADVLDMQHIKGRYYCSEQKLESADFNVISTNSYSMRVIRHFR